MDSALRVAVVVLGGFVLSWGRPAAALTIQLEPNAALVANAPAFAAVQRAAATWEAQLADPVTVTVAVSLEPLSPPTAIGLTTPVVLSADFTVVRDQWAADAAGDPGDEILAALPIAGAFAAELPAGLALGNRIEATKANLKAMGFVGLDGIVGESDGSIVLNDGFGFDFDNSDGVGSGLIDLEATALHEMAHVLGFVSVVDLVDLLVAAGQTQVINPYPFDFFRFTEGGAPADAADFAQAERLLTPGEPAVFSDAGSFEQRLSTGQEGGDGRQAGHWQDDELGGGLIGALDPTLSLGQQWELSSADLRALDLVGWQLVNPQEETTSPVPEPSVGALLLLGFAAVTSQRRRLTRR